MDDTPGETPFVYDEVPYPDAITPVLTPDFLRAGALVRGWSPPDATTASFLEIGCSSGLNSIAIAAAMPGARCVGFDLSASAIERGREMIKSTGLTNVRLEQGDILTYPRDGEKFDYIACHGVYTWIPESVRTPLLELIGARLAPGGVAYFGYDCLPAASVKSALNRYLREQVAGVSDPVAKVDAAIALAGVLNHHQLELSRFKTVLDHLVKDAPTYLRSYVYHDWLAEFYAPVSLPDLARAAAPFGLAFAGDTSLNDLNLTAFDEHARALVDATGDDLVARNVAIDMLRGIHSFRTDIFFRADALPEESSATWHDLSFAFNGKREAGVEDGIPVVKYSDGPAFSVTANADIQKIMDCLLDHYPRELSYGRLREETGLAEAKLDELLYLGPLARLADKHSTPEPFVMEPGERPVVSPLIRSLLAHNEAAVDLRHKRISVKEAPLRLLLVLCDGTRTRAEMATRIAQTFAIEVTQAQIEAAVTYFARQRLFVA